MMTAGTSQRRRGRPFGTGSRTLVPFILIVPVALLLSMVWQSIGEQSDFATLERDGVRYIQALVPLEIALTDAASAAVSGDPAPRGTLDRAVDAVSLVDEELHGQLRTQDRWAGLRTKIESLPTSGSGATIITAYSGANDLLLALLDKVRNNSKLIRDPEVDTYYLEDGAAQELPEGIVAAARYTDLLVSVAGLSAADQGKALVDISSARSELASNARDLSDDVRFAVEGTDSRSLGNALLSKLDRFNRSIDDMVPLMLPVSDGTGSIDVAQVVRAGDEMKAAAAELSAALLTQIDLALRDRLSSLSQRRLLAVGVPLVSLLLALTPVGLTLMARRRKGTATRKQGPPVTAQPGPAHQAPAHQAAVPPQPWPRENVPPQRPEPRPHETSDSEYAQWERFGAPR